MSGPRTPSRKSSLTSISTTDSQNAALLGATKAFGRPPPKARTPSITHVGSNGALAAAVKVGAGTSPSPKHAGGGSTPGRAPGLSPSTITGKGMQRTDGGEPGTGTRAAVRLGVPKPAEPRSRSTSAHAAARLAVARSPEPSTPTTTARPRANTSHKPSVAPKPRRLSGHHRKARNSQPDSPTDDSSIPPTTSLVQLFERKTSGSASPENERRPVAVKVTPSRDLPLRSPKPVRRADGGITSVFQMELGENGNAPKLAPEDTTNGHVVAAGYGPDSSPSSEEYVSASEDTAVPSSPITIRKRDLRAPSISSVDTTNTTSPIPDRLRPSPSPVRQLTSQPIRIQRSASRETASPPGMTSLSSQSAKSIPAQYNMLHPRRMTPLNTGNDLANAIVASSLASSRAPSPHKLEPPPVPTRRQRHGLSLSRSASPVKRAGLRHTLRKEESDDSDASDEDELHPYGKHKKKRHLRKHPNKHHEGDRKRWRDAVTERERKRYEGVFAANKGILCTLTSEEERQLRQSPQPKRPATQDQICNIVARDIWTRSRLPDTVLEDVWDLVDNDSVGRLSKEEFVVGMWLIDQRLKGRKLPVKVTESVWASVRRLQGIKIRKMR